MSLAELSFRTSYHKGESDIAGDFYIPCMLRAINYSRAVGFFRSSIFVLAWPALRNFVSRGGTIRILCSHVLSNEDIDALSAGYSARMDEKLQRHFCEEVKALIEDPLLREPARLLSGLVADCVVDLKVALVGPSTSGARTRIFHDKLGIFEDESANTVVFKGSMNETWLGLAADGNLESVDVAVSWLGDRDSERVTTETEYFEKLWGNEYSGVNVKPFPKVAREDLVAAAPADWSQMLGALLENGSRSPSPADARTLWPHQATALSSWATHDRRGILAFATGAGKTFTAIMAIREALRQDEVPVVILPDRVLFDQWARELQRSFPDGEVGVLRAGAGSSRWSDILRDWTSPGGPPRLVLATIQTASSHNFLAQLRGGPHLMLVVDEVHRAGSRKNSNVLDEQIFAGARLGLSATPERFRDPVGTEMILGFFENILEPRYTLGDAIRDGFLCEYFYRPHVVELDGIEKNAWDRLTKEIGALVTRGPSGDESVESFEQRVDLLRIRRARVIKKAKGKVALARQLLESSFEYGQRWLLYCDDMPQLQAVQTELERSGLPVLVFHSQMQGDRTETLGWLTDRGGIVVAIRCLDEGVDIPLVSHALVLASSQNPREFTQRRGRVLRKAEGKNLAHIHDCIVMPPSGEAAGDAPFATSELSRAIRFSADASNPAAASDLQQIAIELEIDWQALATVGTEQEGR